MKAAIALLDRVSAVICLLAAWCAMVIMGAIVALILTEVILRSFFATSTHITEEYVGYGLGTMIFLGMGHALRQGGLVRVDLLLQRMNAAVRRVTEIALCLVTLGVMGFVMRYFLITMTRNFERGTISMTRAATPVWIPEAIMLTGMVIFCFALTIYCLRLLAGSPMIETSEQVE